MQNNKRRIKTAFSSSYSCCCASAAFGKSWHCLFELVQRCRTTTADVQQHEYECTLMLQYILMLACIYVSFFIINARTRQNKDMVIMVSMRDAMYYTQQDSASRLVVHFTKRKKFPACRWQRKNSVIVYDPISGNDCMGSMKRQRSDIDLLGTRNCFAMVVDMKC